MRGRGDLSFLLLIVLSSFLNFFCFVFVVVMQAFTVMMMSLGSVYGMQSSKKAPQVSNNNSSVSVNAASDVSQSS